jgi:hypothetical protein
MKNKQSALRLGFGHKIRSTDLQCGRQLARARVLVRGKEKKFYSQPRKDGGLEQLGIKNKINKNNATLEKKKR